MRKHVNKNTSLSHPLLSTIFLIKSQVHTTVKAKMAYIAHWSSIIYISFILSPKSITQNRVINTIPRVPTAEAIHIGPSVDARAKHRVPTRVGLDASSIFIKSFLEIFSIPFQEYIFLIQRNISPINAASSSQKYETTNGSSSLDKPTMITTARDESTHERAERIIPFKNPHTSRWEKSDFAIHRMIHHTRATQINIIVDGSKYSLKKNNQNIIAQIVEKRALIAHEIQIGRTL